MDTQLLKKRIRVIQKGSKQGRCVLYVMSRDQRVADNHALIAAQKHALAKGLPLAVVFCLYGSSGYRAREQFECMLSGLREVENDLRKLHIPFMLVIGHPKDRIVAVMHHVEPDALYFDFSPLTGPRQLVGHIVRASAGKPTICVVDTHNSIPLWRTSEKLEVAAYTIRPKLHRLSAEYFVEPDAMLVHPHAWPGVVRPLEELQEPIAAILKELKSNGTQPHMVSGSRAANAHLEAFISKDLARYAEHRNDPSLDAVSNLSPYLHFGHISSLRVVLRLQLELAKSNDNLHIIESSKMPQPSGLAPVRDSVNALIEEMIVRKELSDNFCYYASSYRDVNAAPAWALETLRQHTHDPREHVYTYEQLATSQTHDDAWNAAQTQMTRTGKMHGYMRMYWAKKVLEWTESPQQALDFLIRLNDFYSIDGGDPNGYVGIVWSVAGVHDRPWAERPIFGKVRYMNYGGLKRKFDIETYIRKWS